MKTETPLRGSLTISNPSDGMVRIQVLDTTSYIKFLELRISHSELMQALMGLAERPVDMEVNHLERIGKTMFMDKIEFEVDDPVIDHIKLAEYKAIEFVALNFPSWTPDLYFGSQSSFFRKDGKQFARTTIRKWE